MLSCAQDISCNILWLNFSKNWKLFPMSNHHNSIKTSKFNFGGKSLFWTEIFLTAKLKFCKLEPKVRSLRSSVSKWWLSRGRLNLPPRQLIDSWQLLQPPRTLARRNARSGRSAASSTASTSSPGRWTSWLTRLSSITKLEISWPIDFIQSCVHYNCQYHISTAKM